MSRARQIIAGAVALIFLLGLLGGVPYLLVTYVGWPLPHGVPTWSQFTTALGTRGIPDQTLLKALALAVWLAWASLTTAVLAEVAAVVRGSTSPHLPLAGLLQPLAGHLLAAVLVGALALARPVPSPRLVLPSAGATMGRAPVAAVLVADITPSTARTNGTTPTPVPSTTTYVVRPDDTLWGIAAARLGDAERWKEIFELNRQQPQPDGRSLSNPHWIYPGWVLVLPTTAHPMTSPAQPKPGSSHMSDPAGVPTTTLPPAPAPSPTGATGPVTNGNAPGSARSSAHVGPRGPNRDPVGQMPQRLPSGSLVGGSFVAGVLALLALERLRRRHAYRYRPPVPGRHLGADPLLPTLRALSAAVQPTEDDDEDTSERLPIEIAPAMTDEDSDHRERPDLIEVGEYGGEPLAVSLSELAGIVLSGPGADDVARAWLMALLVRAGPHAAELLMTEASVERLVPGASAAATRAEIPGLRVVADSEAVLRYLEVETLARARQLDVDDSPDVLTYRRTYPWDPLPTVIAVVEEISVEDAERWTAASLTGGRLALAAVILGGDSPSGVRLDIDAEHVVTATSADDISRRLLGLHCFCLQAAEASDVLAELSEVERRPASDDELDAASEANQQDEAWPISVTPIREQMTSGVAPNAPEPKDSAHAEHPAINVRLFGPYEIAVGGEIVASGLRRVARELLAWYLLRPEGASIGAAVDACWPNTDPASVNTSFWRAAADLRKRIGRATQPATQLLVQIGDVYRLEAAAIDCDLWRFQAALGDAAQSDDDGAAREALRRAVACYRGEFVENADYQWVEPVRQDLHYRALDAQLRLAELEEQLGAPDAAEEVLGRAIELDRYAEEPYRRLMVLQGKRGRLDAVGATWRLLERSLAEIDVDPENATVRLYRSLSADTTPAGNLQRAHLS